MDFKKLKHGIKDALHDAKREVKQAVSGPSRPHSYPENFPLPVPAAPSVPEPFNPNLDRPPISVKLIKQGLNGEAPLNVHDPNVIRTQDGTLFMFGTGEGALWHCNRHFY
jgi:hypothetical protein